MEQTGHALGIVTQTNLLEVGQRTSWDLVKHHDMGPCGAVCVGMRIEAGMVKAVLIPQSAFNLPRWQELNVGDHIVVHGEDGVQYSATVLWTSPTQTPPSAAENTIFQMWLDGPDWAVNL